MITLKRELQPDLVVTPTTDDIHQDHSVVSIESKQAFKATSILGYEVPWNNFDLITLPFRSSVNAMLRPSARP